MSSKALQLKLEEKGVLHGDVSIGYLNLGQIYSEWVQAIWHLTLGRRPKICCRYWIGEKASWYRYFIIVSGPYITNSSNICLPKTILRKHWKQSACQPIQCTINQVEAFDLVSSPPEFLSAQLNLAKVYGARGNESSQDHHFADSLFRLCVDYIEQIRFGLLNDEAKQALQEPAVQTYNAAIRFYLKDTPADHLQELFDLFEKSKSYSLKNQIQAKTIAERHHIPKEILDTQHELCSDIDKMQKRLVGENELSDSLKALYYTAHEKLRDFQDLIKREYPAYYLEKYRNKSDTLIALQKRLGSNELVLYFHLLDDRLLCLRIGKQIKDLIQIEIDSNFENEIKNFLSLVSDSQSSFPNLVEALSGQALSFMPKLLEDIPENSELIIVPHQVLASMPFELLLISVEPVHTLPKRNLPYLFRRFTVQYAYSASTIHTTSQVIKPMMYLGAAPMCCADSVEGNSNLLSGQLPLLPYSAIEIRMSAMSWRGDTMFSAQATKNKFLTAALNHNILHLATHGVIDHDHPLYHSRLLFFDDEQSVTPDLYIHELYQLDLDAQLAVLSACNTGIGPHQTGEGMLSLARAFRYANCPNIVTSLWSVNDQSTAKIMSLFFQFLKEGKGIATALSSAKTEFLRTVPTESEYQLHPYFWAGFIAIADNEILMLFYSHEAIWPRHPD